MFTFFRLPKCLVNNVYFAELSADAKLLYAFFLDRVSLSIKNGWIKNGDVINEIKNLIEWIKTLIS